MSTFDLDRLVEKAGNAPEIEVPGYANSPQQRRARIGVSDDSCFNLCFQDNLDLLRYYGAELVSFSPLADSSVPDGVGALYITGAYLSEYGEELSNNSNFHQSIRDFVDAGGVLYSEGGGTAYLCDDYSPSMRSKPLIGAGVIPGSAEPQNGFMNFTESVSMEETVLGPPGTILKSIDTGEWALEERNPILRAFRVNVNRGKSFSEGFSPGPQVLNTFGFVHFGSNPEVAKALVNAAQVVSPIK